MSYEPAPRVPAQLTPGGGSIMEAMVAGAIVGGVFGAINQIDKAQNVPSAAMCDAGAIALTRLGVSCADVDGRVIARAVYEAMELARTDEAARARG